LARFFSALARASETNDSPPLSPCRIGAMLAQFAASVQFGRARVAGQFHLILRDGRFAASSG